MGRLADRRGCATASGSVLHAQHGRGMTRTFMPESSPSHWRLVKRRLHPQNACKYSTSKLVSIPHAEAVQAQTLYVLMGNGEVALPVVETGTVVVVKMCRLATRVRHSASSSDYRPRLNVILNSDRNDSDNDKPCLL